MMTVFCFETFLNCFFCASGGNSFDCAGCGSRRFCKCSMGEIGWAADAALVKVEQEVGTSRKFNVSQITKVGVHSAHLIFFHFFREKCARALLESMLVLPELLLQAPGETSTSHASHDLSRIQ